MDYVALRAKAKGLYVEKAAGARNYIAKLRKAELAVEAALDM